MDESLATLTQSDVKSLIKSTVAELLQKVADHSDEGRVYIMKNWAYAKIPLIEAEIIKEIKARHVQGVTFAIWAGPPGAGKGTNIATVSAMGAAYAEYVSQGNAEILSEPYHAQMLKYSLSQASISTGTGGMFNMPVGEYDELFGPLKDLIGGHVSSGGFVADSLVSLLVEMMILLRLSQGFHRIQIDLWPRTLSQFRSYERFVAELVKHGCKISQELVSLRVVSEPALVIIRNNAELAGSQSLLIGQVLSGIVDSTEYKEAKMRQWSVGQMQERFLFEQGMLDTVLLELKRRFLDSIGAILVEELEIVCERMKFRFNKAIEMGAKPRTDEFPLSLLRRLAIYTQETSPAFLHAAADAQDGVPVAVASTFGTPEVVITDLLDELVFGGTDNEAWQKFKKLAGTVAKDYVNRKEPIVEDLQKAIGGIFVS